MISGRLGDYKGCMKKIIAKIFHQALEEKVDASTEIAGLGCVNKIFEVIGKKGDYIIRLNTTHKRIEYKKEKWCLEKVATMDIPSPKVLCMGIAEEVVYMIQTKIVGDNGATCSASTKRQIWKDLGSYAQKYHHIGSIDDDEVTAAEFHKNWKARLRYNISQLNENDSLLSNNVLTPQHHTKIKEILYLIENKDFKTGLVHGDLSPRNVIWTGTTSHLLDWGTAEINVVPHHEIGTVLISKEANEANFHAFLEGLSISKSAYHDMKKDIKILMLLHCLDKYRWAEDFHIEQIKDYENNILEAFHNL